MKVKIFEAIREEIESYAVNEDMICDMDIRDDENYGDPDAVHFIVSFKVWNNPLPFEINLRINDRSGNILIDLEENEGSWVFLNEMSFWRYLFFQVEGN